jgi:hypothetical protein
MSKLAWCSVLPGWPALHSRILRYYYTTKHLDAKGGFLHDAGGILGDRVAEGASEAETSLRLCRAIGYARVGVPVAVPPADRLPLAPGL